MPLVLVDGATAVIEARTVERKVYARSIEQDQLLWGVVEHAAVEVDVLAGIRRGRVERICGRLRVLPVTGVVARRPHVAVVVDLVLKADPADIPERAVRGKEACAAKVYTIDSGVGRRRTADGQVRERESWLMAADGSSERERSTGSRATEVKHRLCAALDRDKLRIERDRRGGR
jgi:hypothetical protein